MSEAHRASGCALRGDGPAHHRSSPVPSRRSGDLGDVSQQDCPEASPTMPTGARAMSRPEQRAVASGVREAGTLPFKDCKGGPGSKLRTSRAVRSDVDTGSYRGGSQQEVLAMMRKCSLVLSLSFAVIVAVLVLGPGA